MNTHFILQGIVMEGINYQKPKKRVGCIGYIFTISKVHEKIVFRSYTDGKQTMHELGDILYKPIDFMEDEYLRTLMQRFDGI